MSPHWQPASLALCFRLFAPAVACAYAPSASSSPWAAPHYPPGCPICFPWHSAPCPGPPHIPPLIAYCSPLRSALADEAGQRVPVWQDRGAAGGAGQGCCGEPHAARAHVHQAGPDPQHQVWGPCMLPGKQPRQPCRSPVFSAHGALTLQLCCLSPPCKGKGCNYNCKQGWGGGGGQL